MPDWIEPYRDLFTNTGGNSIETLMNAPPNTGRTNVVLGSLAIAMEAQLHLLYRLREAGMLAEVKR